MTSSLVGSEMCIRDSFCHVLFFADGAFKPEEISLPVHRAGLPRMGLRKPVSYTHLTLPTICSV
eukprot:12158165-Prorocentrum_lima.AAC.1